jgi:hypothetical protein
MRLVVLKDSLEGQKLNNPGGLNNQGKPRKLKPDSKIKFEDKEPELGKDGWALWHSYDLGNDPIDLVEDKLSYAYFCCGYLHYYDEITRNDCQNHSIYFVWKNENKTVEIWINPPADTFKSKSPAQTGIDPQPPPAPPPPPQYS